MYIKTIYCQFRYKIMKKVFYWSPFTSKVATVKSVINSAYSVNKYLNKNSFRATIIDAVHEWKDYSNI